MSLGMPLVPALSSAPLPIGRVNLSRLAFHNLDLTGLRAQLRAHAAMQAQPGLLMDLAALETVLGNAAEAQLLQTRALQATRLFHLAPAPTASPPVRLLIVMASGDFMANTPLEFLLEKSGIAIQMVFCRPGEALPDTLPAHDVVFVAVGDSGEHRATLAALARQLANWPVPVINHPAAIGRLGRCEVAALLQGLRGVVVPEIVALSRDALAGDAASAPLFDDAVLIRPIDSHAGHGLQRLTTRAELGVYLDTHAEANFYVSRFVDISDAAGIYRKYRVAFVDGQAYAGHMALSRHWMIHYLNAGMADDAGKRAEEARWMTAFDTDFAVRHAAAFAQIVATVGLDYFVMDCGETRDGELLVFELDAAMILHDLDHPALFAYKRPSLQKLFSAVQSLIRARAASGAASHVAALRCHATRH